MFMSMCDKVSTNVKRVLTDLIIGDIYWGVLTPSQALLMLYGSPPPTTKEAPKVFREIFVEKEKLLEKKYADILEKIIKTYKDFEHEKIKDGDLKGIDVDAYLKDAEDFLKRLKELRIQIEKRSNEKIISEIYESVFNMLIGAFGKKKEADLILDFEKNFIKKGNLPDFYLKILKDLAKAKEDFKKGKLDKNEVENVRKNATTLINHLIEFNQRCEISNMQKGRVHIKTKDRQYELVLTENNLFVIDAGKVKKLSHSKIEDSTIEELTRDIESSHGKELALAEKELEILKKHLGNFEIIL